MDVGGLTSSGAAASADPNRSARWPSIRRKLEAAAPDLFLQGGLVTKGTRDHPAWAVRYVDRRAPRPRHRSVYLGGPVYRDLAAGWLADLRRPAGWAAEVAAAARLAAGLAALLGRLERAWR